MTADRRIVLRGIAREVIAIVSGGPSDVDAAKRLRRCARMMLAIAGSLPNGGS